MVKSRSQWNTTAWFLNEIWRISNKIETLFLYCCPNKLMEENTTVRWGIERLQDILYS